MATRLTTFTSPSKSYTEFNFCRPTSTIFNPSLNDAKRLGAGPEHILRPAACVSAAVWYLTRITAT
eukprot:m.483528 g.483528  ORF g.483528 m.483528 type:complete len:66 (-) comp65163_c0_seq1:437-634(-)